MSWKNLNYANYISRGVIPSGAVFPAERGISRAIEPESEARNV